ncbi:glycoside hydrolase family 16 protein [Streptomyces sp. MS1.AVA.1]|uniref:Glycoside hydrolase family 16 protein n=1 Tax=Streptomyces machairae TaxID=3134109 RepID=A0ABU8UN10_9ACTN
MARTAMARSEPRQGGGLGPPLPLVALVVPDPLKGSHGPTTSRPAPRRGARRGGPRAGARGGHGERRSRTYDDHGGRPRGDRRRAVRLGEPLPQGSDEFDYGSEAEPAVPDRDRWRLAGGGPDTCWPGHGDNGRRCDVNTRVVGGILRMTGEADGDSAWLASSYGRRYGRWEARVRSRATAPDNGRQYHPLLILWPDSNRHPEDGEYDYLENGAPGEQCAEAFLHYPHPEGVPVQQEFAQRCGVDLTQWHNVAVERTRTTCGASSTARSGSASPTGRTTTVTACSAPRRCTRPSSSTTSTVTTCRARSTKWTGPGSTTCRTTKA